MKCEAEGKILVELPSTGGVTRDGKDWGEEGVHHGNQRTLSQQDALFRLQFRWSC